LFLVEVFIERKDLNESAHCPVGGPDGAEQLRNWSAINILLLRSKTLGSNAQPDLYKNLGEVWKYLYIMPQPINTSPGF
jgi:hypothetical protein